MSAFGLCRVSCLSRGDDALQQEGCGAVSMRFFYGSLTTGLALGGRVRRKGRKECNTAEGRLVGARDTSEVHELIVQYQFRLKALGGEIPGVHKASW